MFIAIPISNLFKQKKGIGKVIEISDCFEVRDLSFNSKIPKQYLYHSEINLASEWTEVEKHKLNLIAIFKKELKLISFHLATRFSNPVMVGKMFQPGGKEYKIEDMVNNSKENVKTVKKIFDKSIEIAIENNNYYPTPAYKIVTENDFLSEIIYKNSIKFLLDISHARITAYNRKIKFKNYLKKLPLDKCVQVHISEHTIKNNIAYDSHVLLSEDNYQFLKCFLKDNKNLKYLTVEYYKSIPNLIMTINRIKRIVENL